MSEIKTELLQTSIILATQLCNKTFDNPNLLLITVELVNSNRITVAHNTNPIVTPL
jgi:hypothetical protein